jgi:hypothetical protein
VALGPALFATKVYSHPDIGRTYARAWERQVPEVTDGDLFALNSFRQIPIVTPATFVRARRVSTSPAP